MATRVTDGARRERHAKSSSRVSRRACIALTESEEKRDCSRQSTGNGVDNDSERKVVCIFRLNSKN